MPLGARLAIPDDFIRTFAIFLVILLHASNETLQTPSVPAGYWWTAVIYKSLSLSCAPLFVMLSGAMLLQPTKLDEPIGLFLKKRFNRIGPAFAFWSAVYLAWAFYTSGFPLTVDNMVQGVFHSLFGGAYYHFWFIYLIVGLYLITPILRVIVSSGNLRILQYLVLVWFAGVAIVPLIQLASGLVLNNTVFVIGGWVGYFVLGVSLQRMKLRSLVLYGLAILSFSWTIFGIWLMNFPLKSLGQNYFFFDYLTANVIIGSVTLFMILLKHQIALKSGVMILNKIVRVISKNTLPIFLFHVIVLESFQRGFFGFRLSVTTLDPLIEIPLLTLLTLFTTLGSVLLMQKIPFLKKVIG